LLTTLHLPFLFFLFFISFLFLHISLCTV
jgi:hypothetical protein